MDLGPHAGFIVASYGLCLLTVVGLIVWIKLDRINQERALKELSEQGLSRAAPDSGSEAKQ